MVHGWSALEGGKLHRNWHQDLMADYLEAVYYGEIQNLLINIQPRVLKSMLASVYFPCWWWLSKPFTRFLCISYAGSLANDHNWLRRNLVQSKFFQQVNPTHLDLVLGKNRISEFANSRFGIMIARGLDGSVTGVGGDVLIIDDPNDPEKVESEMIRDRNLKRTRGLMSTRKNNPNAQTVIIQQRTHLKDVSGWAQEEMAEEFDMVILPTTAKKYTVITFPRQKNEDGTPRTIERQPGDLLDPNWFGEKKIKTTRRSLGPTIYAARYQQDPVAIEGGVIQEAHFRRYVKEDFPAYPSFWIVSADTAQEDKEDVNSPWAITLAAGYCGELFVRDFYMDWHNYPTGRKKFIELMQEWKIASKPHYVLIEKKSTGATLIQEFWGEFAYLGLNVIPIEPKGSKVERMNGEAGFIHSRRLWLPKWVPELETSLIQFPQGQMDPVDTMSQMLMYCREMGLLANWQARDDSYLPDPSDNVA